MIRRMIPMVLLALAVGACGPTSVLATEQNAVAGEETTGHSAKTWIVAPAGSDEAANVLQTIADAARRAKAGDRVLIKPGTYKDEVLVHHEGTPEAPIVFEAEKPGTVILTGPVA